VYIGSTLLATLRLALRFPHARSPPPLQPIQLAITEMVNPTLKMMALLLLLLLAPVALG